MALEAFAAARSESCSLMYEALETILRSTNDLSIADVHSILKDYETVIQKKRSLYGVMSSTMELSCDLTETEVKQIDCRRSDLISGILPLIQSMIDLYDKNKPKSPDKNKISGTIDDLRSVAEELGCKDRKLWENIVTSAVPVISSDAGLGSSGALSSDRQASGSLEDVSRIEKESDGAGISRFFRDVDSALMLIDMQWIPPRIPVIMGEICNYPKEAVDCFGKQYEGPARLFIHFGLVFIRKHKTKVHAAVAGSIAFDLCIAMNQNLPTREFVVQGEMMEYYINRLGCGYPVPKESDGGIGFSCWSPHFGEGNHFIAIEVAFTHENLLGIYLEAALYLGPGSHVRCFIGAHISTDADAFWIRLYIIRKKADPKPHGLLCGTVEKCAGRYRDASAQVGNETVRNDDLPGWSTERINETFDIDLVRILEADHSHFDENGGLLEPDRFAFSIELELGPGDVRHFQLDLSETVIQAFAVWRSYYGVELPLAEPDQDDLPHPDAQQ